MKLADFLTLMQGYWLTLRLGHFRLDLMERGPENEFPKPQFERHSYGWCRAGSLRYAATPLFQSPCAPEIGPIAWVAVNGEIQGR